MITGMEGAEYEDNITTPTPKVIRAIKNAKEQLNRLYHDLNIVIKSEYPEFKDISIWTCGRLGSDSEEIQIHGDPIKDSGKLGGYLEIKI
tara:strand:- start:288 stop:557 length:270 start_codon:yes stop_codon:yes gene_type:complete